MSLSEVHNLAILHVSLEKLFIGEKYLSIETELKANDLFF